MKRFLVLLILIGGAQFAWKHYAGPFNPTASSELTVEQLQALAATVKAGEIVMYSTPECTYCGQAKSWLNQYGFVFADCNMRTEPRCEREFMAYGGTGTPYLIVRGHHLKNGFDSDEFLAALLK